MNAAAPPRLAVGAGVRRLAPLTPAFAPDGARERDPARGWAPSPVAARPGTPAPPGVAARPDYGGRAGATAPLPRLRLSVVKTLPERSGAEIPPCVRDDRGRRGDSYVPRLRRPVSEPAQMRGLKATSRSRRSLTAFGMTNGRWGGRGSPRGKVSGEPGGADARASRQHPGVRRSLTAFGMTKGRHGNVGRSDDRGGGPAAKGGDFANGISWGGRHIPPS